MAAVVSFNDVTISVAVGVHGEDRYVCVSKNKEIDFVISRAAAIELVACLQDAIKYLTAFEPS